MSPTQPTKPNAKQPSVAAAAMKKIAATCGPKMDESLTHTGDPKRCVRNEKAALASMAIRRVRTPGEAWIRGKCAREANQTFAIQDACEAALMPAAREIDRLLREK